jgi:hypothetical protein
MTISPRFLIELAQFDVMHIGVNEFSTNFFKAQNPIFVLALIAKVMRKSGVEFVQVNQGGKLGTENSHFRQNQKKRSGIVFHSIKFEHSMSFINSRTINGVHCTTGN